LVTRALSRTAGGAAARPEWNSTRADRIAQTALPRTIRAASRTRHRTETVRLSRYTRPSLVGLEITAFDGGILQDIGSSNFWYAAVLHVFFRPAETVGIELDGHRISINGYSRLDYAHGYIQDLPNTRFFVGDYARYNHPADVVTAWYPFVTPGPVLAGGMPLSLLAPRALFNQVVKNLQPHGLFFMVNQGSEEAAIAAAWCEKVGLARYGTRALKATLRSRLPAVASYWMRS
jgi:hypothetical protein